MQVVLPVSQTCQRGLALFVTREREREGNPLTVANGVLRHSADRIVFAKLTPPPFFSSFILK